MTTARSRFVPGEPEAGGYRKLATADGDPHVVRSELAGASLPADWPGRTGQPGRSSVRPLLVLAHLSDVHLMDHQSPG